MKRYNNEEYFSVIDKRTGKKLLDCGKEMDALVMVSFDPHNRTYTRNQFLMGQVVDIQMPKALPTNEIIVNSNSSWNDESECLNGVRPSSLPQIKLPDRQSEPFRA